MSAPQVEKNLAKLVGRLAPEDKKAGRALLGRLTRDEKALLAQWASIHAGHGRLEATKAPWRGAPSKEGDEEHFAHFLSSGERKTLDSLRERLPKPNKELLYRMLKRYCKTRPSS